MRIYSVGAFIFCCLLAWFRGCHMDFRQALWQKTGTTTSVENNKNAADCAINYLAMNHIGVRVKVTGGKMTCESLPFDWLTNQITSPGYLYLYKTWSKLDMDPPRSLRVETGMNYTTLLPGILSEGGSLAIKFSSKNIDIYLLNESKNKLTSVQIKGSETMHVVHYKNNEIDKFDKFEKDLPDCGSSVCELTFYAGAEHIVISTDKSWFQRYDLNSQLLLTAVRTIDVPTSAHFATKVDIYCLELQTP